jgi:hypothetical protein
MASCGFEARVFQAAIVVDVLEPKSSFVAHEVPLGLRVLPRPQPVDFVLVLIDMDAASGRAAGAHALGMLKPPDPLFVQKVFAAQSTHRAKIDDVAS